MNHRELLYYCVEILDTYSNSFLSPEDHLSQYLTTRVSVLLLLIMLSLLFYVYGTEIVGSIHVVFLFISF